MKLYLFLLTLASAACLHAADDAAIIDGPHYAFLIAAPKGWKLTTTRLMPAAFYPVGGSIEKSPVIMYVRPGDKQQLGIASIADLNQVSSAAP